MRRASRGQILSWTLFDFANTGFHVIILTLVYPIYFSDAIAGGRTAPWGWTIATSMLITALIGPLLGSIADASNRKKRFLAAFTVACVVATAGLYFTGPGTLALAVILVVVANIGFEGGTIFYDAFLPELVPETEYGRVSGYGYAMGYLGSFLSLMAILPIVTTDDGSSPDVRPTFLVAAAFLAIFSLPLFRNVPETPRDIERAGNPLVVGYRRVRDTLSHLRRYDPVKRFLTAFFVYNDAILTAILFAGIFAKDVLKLSFTELAIFFMIVQGSALVGSLIFGRLTNRLGARQTIAITLGIWIAVSVSAYFVESKTAFYLVGAFAGIALGSSQSTSRAMMALLTPAERTTEFFGFYDGFFGKASAVIGPAIFGEVADAFGERPAMLALSVIFLLGIALVMRVPDVRPDAERASSSA